MWDIQQFRQQNMGSKPHRYFDLQNILFIVYYIVKFLTFKTGTWVASSGCTLLILQFGESIQFLFTVFQCQQRPKSGFITSKMVCRLVRYKNPVPEVILFLALMYETSFDACFRFSGSSIILLRKDIVDAQRFLFSVN